MAQATVYRIHRIDDLTLIRICREVISVFEGEDPKCNLEYFPGFRIPLSEIDEADLAGRYAINEATVSVNFDKQTNFLMSFTRRIAEPGGEVASAIYNEIKCEYGREAERWRERRLLVEKIQGILGAVDLPETGRTNTGQEGVLRELLVGFAAQHRSMLQSLDTKIGAIEDRRKELDAETERKEEERRKQHQDALADLDKQRAELERQSHMAERRRLLKQVTENTAQRVGRSIAPKGAILARWGVFVTCLLIAGCAAWLAVSSFAALGAPVFAGSQSVPRAAHDALDWVLLVRAIISSLVAVGALVYAAAWLRRFYDQDLAAARDIERFTYDLNRASWIIETVLEVQQEKKGEVPDAWLAGATRGLFDDRGRDAPDQASQALSALLGFTASASFGPDGPRFELNRRAARRIAQAASEDGK